MPDGQEVAEAIRACWSNETSGTTDGWTVENPAEVNVMCRLLSLGIILVAIWCLPRCLVTVCAVTTDPTDALLIRLPVVPDDHFVIGSGWLSQSQLAYTKRPARMWHADETKDSTAAKSCGA